MKKSLLAVAAMTAFAGAAQAQSSVSVYGIVDVGFLRTEGVSGASNTATATASNGLKTISSAFNHSNLATSRLGFKGVEDIGGGVKANFVAEIGLTPTSNGFSGSTNMAGTALGAGYPNNSQGLDNRQTYLGLSKAGTGEVRVGRQYTPVHEAMCAQNAGQCNGVAGDMMYSGANSSNTITTANTQAVNPQIRASNSIRFSSEKVMGFEASGLYAANNKEVTDSNTTAQLGLGSVNYRTAGGQIAYTGIKNLDARYSFQRTSINRDNANATTTANNLIGGAWFTLTPGSVAIARDAERDQYMGVSYDFGIVKAALQNSIVEVESLNNLTARKSATQGALTAPITSAIAAWASYGKGTYRSSTSATSYNFSGYQAGATYALSKRTSLYAIYGSATQDGIGTIKYSDAQYALGAKHTF